MAIAQRSKVQTIGFKEIVDTLRPEMIQVINEVQKALSGKLGITLQIDPTLIIKKDDLNKQVEQIEQQIKEAQGKASKAFEKIDKRREYKGKNDDLKALEEYKNRRSEKIRELGSFDKKGNYALNDAKDLKEFAKNLREYEDASRRIEELVVKLKEADPKFKYSKNKNDINLAKLIPEYKIDGQAQSNIEAMAARVGEIYKEALQRNLSAAKAELDDVTAQYNQAIFTKASQAKGVGASAEYERREKLNQEIVGQQAEQIKYEEKLVSLIHSELGLYDELESKIGILIDKKDQGLRLNEVEEGQYQSLTNKMAESQKRLIQAYNLYKEFGLSLSEDDVEKLSVYEGEGGNKEFGSAEAGSIRAAADRIQDAKEGLIDVQRNLSDLADVWKVLKDLPEAREYVDASVREIQQENSALKARLAELENRIAEFQGGAKTPGDGTGSGFTSGSGGGSSGSGGSGSGGSGSGGSRGHGSSNGSHIDGVNDETGAVDNLSESVKVVTTAVNEKTNAFENEHQKVVGWINEETNALGKLNEGLKKTAGLLNGVDAPERQKNQSSGSDGHGGSGSGSDTSRDDFSSLHGSVSSVTQSINRFGDAVSGVTDRINNIDIKNSGSKKNSPNTAPYDTKTSRYVSAVDTLVDTQSEYTKLSLKETLSNKETKRLSALQSMRTRAHDVMDANPVDHKTFMLQRERMIEASRLAAEAVRNEAEAERELAKAEAEQVEQARIAAQAKEEKAKQDAAVKAEQERQAELAETYKKFDYLEKNMDRYVQGTLFGDSGDDWESFSKTFEETLAYAKNLKAETIGIIEAKRKLNNAEEEAYLNAEIENGVRLEQQRVNLIAQAKTERKNEADELVKMDQDIGRAFATNTSSKSAKDSYSIFASTGMIDEQAAEEKEWLAKISKYQDLQSKISNLLSKQATVGLTPNQSQKLDEYRDKLTSLESAFDDLEDGVLVSDKVKDAVNNMAASGERDITSYNKILSEFNKNFAFVRKLSDGSEDSIKDALQQYIKDEGGRDLKNFTGTGTKNGVSTFTAEFTGADGAIRKLNASLNTTDNTLRGVVKSGRSTGQFFSELVDTISNKWRSFIGYLSTQVTVMQLWGILKQGIAVVKELDSAFVELKRISNDSASALEDFRKRQFELADTVGTTSATIINAATEWEHLGYSIKEAEELAKTSAIYKNIADGMTSDSEATEDLVSILKAYNFEANQAMDVTDALIATSNNYAVTAADIGNILKRSSAALAMGGNSFEETVALGTAMNEVLQSAEVAGSSLKVLSLRLRSSKTELADMGEETDNLVESTPKLRTQIKALTKGFDILGSDGKTIKSTYEIMKGIAAVWEDMSDVDQAALLELIAGKTRAQGVSALLSNWSQVDNVLKTIAEDEGIALRNNEEKLNTIQGRLTKLTNASQKLASDALNTELIKDFISGVTGAVNALDTLIQKIGLLPTAAGAIGLGTTFTKGGGQLNQSSYPKWMKSYKAPGIVRGNTKQVHAF